MTRKNPFVHVGRPPAPKLGGGLPGSGGVKPTRGSALPQAPMGASPTEGMSTGIPGAAFKRGGGVPAYHDDARMSKSHGEHGFASCDDHFCRGGRT